jgi:hypothetical protein
MILHNLWNFSWLLDYALLPPANTSIDSIHYGDFSWDLRMCSCSSFFIRLRSEIQRIKLSWISLFLLLLILLLLLHAKNFHLSIRNGRQEKEEESIFNWLNSMPHSHSLANIFFMCVYLELQIEIIFVIESKIIMIEILYFPPSCLHYFRHIFHIYVVRKHITKYYIPQFLWIWFIYVYKQKIHFRD